MHLRRAVLLMAMVLAVVALAEALVPVPRERRAERRQPPPPAPPPRAAVDVRTITVRYPARGPIRPVRVAAGTHVVLEVATAAAGEASVAGLGLVQPAEPDSPARFDILADRPGTYTVDFDPAAGRGAAVARLVVARRA
jgi:hypothetical protein